MTCDACLPLLDAYLDRELELERSVEVEGHLAGCTDCTKRLASLRALQTLVRERALRPTISPELIARLQRSTRPRRWSWRTGAALALAAGLAALVFAGLHRSKSLDEELVDAHLRSMQSGQLAQVQSANGDTVESWLRGQLSYDVDAPELSKAGFALVGARVDTVENHPVAALVYRRAEHVINVFAWPDATVQDGEETVRGFHCVIWREGPLAYWAVSDLDDTELRKLAGLMRAAD